jgi:hypothetical protein
LGLLALAGAVVLGLAGDLLLRATPWGLNAPTWIALLVIGVVVLVHQTKLSLLGEARWLLLPALVFAAGIAWRDSSALVAVNVLAVVLTLGLAAHRTHPGWPRIGGLLDYLVALISAAIHAMGGILALAFADIQWGEIPRTGATSVVLAVLRGLLIAIPLLVLFGGLFMAADAVFSGLVSDVFNIDVKEAVTHLFWIGLWTWLTAGFLRQLLFCTIAVGGLAAIGAKLDPGATSTDATAPTESTTAVVDTDTHQGSDAVATSAATSTGLGAATAVADRPDDADPLAPAEAATSSASTRRAPPKPKRPNGRVALLGPVELCIVLGLLDVLFLAFVIVQFRYLFGGAELVRVSTTLTYAEYARRGFFELVWVAALLLPIMLTIDWLARLDTPRHARLYLILAGALVGLLFVVIASALFRMRLYTQEYGLTELRLYTSAFMGWITLVAAWYLGTVLRDRREKFVFGGLVAGLLVAFALDAVNPDDLIVRTNAARSDAPSRFDGAYTSLLSADAVPSSIEALPLMPDNQRRNVANSLLRRWRPPETIDWRTLNYGRWTAWQAVAANEAALRQIAGWPPTGEPAPQRSSRGDRLDIPTPD